MATRPPCSLKWTGLYADRIDPLTKSIYRVIRGRIKKERLTKDYDQQLQRFSQQVAVFEVLGAQYGQGDAVAGVQLSRLSPAFIQGIYKNLNALGLKLLEPRFAAKGQFSMSEVFSLSSEIREANWGDAKLQDELQALD